MPGAGIAESVQALRELFVDVDDHRILLFRIEVIRLEKQTLQRNAVCVFETHQFAGAPVVCCALRVAIADALQFPEGTVRDPNVGKLIEARCGHDQHVGIFRFRGIVEILRGHQEFLRQRSAVDFVAIETGVACLLVFGLRAASVCPDRSNARADRVAHSAALSIPCGPHRR